jgi:hypothetical protein
MFDRSSDGAGDPYRAEKDRLERAAPLLVIDVHDGTGGGPPTLISAPSRRPKVCSAVCTSMSAVTGSELSPITPIARSTPPKLSAARAVSDGVSPVMTTCAPSATSSCAVKQERFLADNPAMRQLA